MRSPFTMFPLGLVSLVMVTGCPGPAPTPEPAPIARLTTVTVACEPASVIVGKSAQCTASALDQDGKAFAVEGYTWTSSDESLATVDAQGKATTRAVGTLQVNATASSGGNSQQGSASLTVTPVPETVHSEHISKNETWRASDNPHVVTRALSVAGPGEPTLTLEAGVVVRFATGAGLYVGAGSELPGRLVAEGTASTPVRFTSNTSTPRPGDWGGLVLFPANSTSSRLAHAVIEYAGGRLATEDGESSDSMPQAGLLLYGELGEQTSASRPTLVVDHVEVRDSQTNGVVSFTGAFGEGSTALNVHDSAQADLWFTANEVGSIPADTVLTANSAHTVHVTAGSVSRTQTWPKLAQPYRFVSIVEGLPAMVSVGGESEPVLTLTAGSEFQMPADAVIIAGLSDPGAIVAVGTEAAPIRFVPSSTTPTKGFWSGLHFMKATGSRLDYVQVSHAGSKLYGILGGGGVNVSNEFGAFMTHSLIQESSGCGVAVGASVTTDFTLAEYGNTFVNGEGGAQCSQ